MIMNKKTLKGGLESNRVNRIPDSAIHEMTRLSAHVPDPAFLSWAKPTSGTPEHINQAACEAIQKGLVGGYSVSVGMPELRNISVDFICWVQMKN